MGATWNDATLRNRSHRKHHAVYTHKQSKCNINRLHSKNINTQIYQTHRIKRDRNGGLTKTIDPRNQPPNSITKNNARCRYWLLSNDRSSAIRRQASLISNHFNFTEMRQNSFIQQNSDTPNRPLPTIITDRLTLQPICACASFQSGRHSQSGRGSHWESRVSANHSRPYNERITRSPHAINLQDGGSTSPDLHHPA